MNRRSARDVGRAWVICCVIAGLMLVAGVAACSGRDHPLPASTPSVGVIYRSPRAADGGQVRMVESGFTVLPPTVWHRGTAFVSYGIILENSSKVQAAVGTFVNIRFFDADGALVPIGLFDYIPERSVTILPGMREGIGDADAPRAGGNLGTIVRMQVEIVNPSWIPADQAESMTTSQVTAGRDGDGLLTVTFTVTSTFRQTMIRLAVDAVFRDASGKVVAGLRKQPLGHCPPGISTQHALFDGHPPPLTHPPPTADLDRTELYLFQW